MPRAIWSGAISFGLVNVPVKLFSAVSRKTVRFHQIDGESGSRIQQKRVSAASGEEVPYENLVKGYEIGPDRYVIITPEELDSISPEKTRTIDIEDFVDLDQIDPIFYDHPYYLVPDTGAEKAYKLLVDAMDSSAKVAIARVVLRSKENLVAIRPRDGVLAMETMLFGDEVISADELDSGAGESKKKTSKRELDMATQLIESLSSDFDPDKYRDEYRDRVLEMIERKAQGEDIVIEQPSEEPAEGARPDGRTGGQHRRGQEPGRTQEGPGQVIGRRAKSSNGRKASNSSAKAKSGSTSRRKTAKKS